MKLLSNTKQHWNFLLYANQNEKTIGAELGKSEYSYYFVLKSYIPILEQLGDVHIIDKPQLQISKKVAELGRDSCVFLSFTPPHQCYVPADCYSVCVFAWEYSTLPNETFVEGDANDWITVLSKLNGALTHSRYIRQQVRNEMPEGYVCESIPAPIWDAYAPFKKTFQYDQLADVRTLSSPGAILDVRYCKDSASIQSRTLRAPHNEPVKVEVTGVVYTTITNINDERKNWIDTLTAFCSAFKHRNDAVLVVKSTYYNFDFCENLIKQELAQLIPFDCRIVLIHGYLNDEAYSSLIDATQFTVNSAHGEGQCLPLMEFMSAGKPAVAPSHTAMNDYIDAKNSFVVGSSPEWSFWPHDSRLYFRTFRERINWESMRTAFNDSYLTAKKNAPKYNIMALQAQLSLQQYCSRKENTGRLKEFLQQLSKTKVDV